MTLTCFLMLCSRRFGWCVSLHQLKNNGSTRDSNSNTPSARLKNICVQFPEKRSARLMCMTETCRPLGWRCGHLQTVDALSKTRLPRLKGVAKTPVMNLLRLNSLRGTKTTFSTPEMYDEPSPVIFIWEIHPPGPGLHLSYMTILRLVKIKSTLPFLNHSIGGSITPSHNV